MLRNKIYISWNSNTTLVKVKYDMYIEADNLIVIQIQHLLKLNRPSPSAIYCIVDSNTTLVKVKCFGWGNGGWNGAAFKYNTC